MHKRREFIKQLAMLSGSLMLPASGIGWAKNDKWGEILPLRKLGKTGESVTMLGLGGYGLLKKILRKLLKKQLKVVSVFLIRQNHTETGRARHDMAGILSRSIAMMYLL
jgi:hypothetical protein